MVGVGGGDDSKTIFLMGEGLEISKDFQISPSVCLTSFVPPLDLDTTVAGCATFADYAAAVHGNEVATFSLRITEDRGGKDLVTRAWNALWVFHLLSLACRTPTRSLYSMSDGEQPRYFSTNRAPIQKPLGNSYAASEEQLAWAKENHSKYDSMFGNSEFVSALRCLGNAAYLDDDQVRIMLLWSGIEGLLSVDTELRRRLALYAALLISGSADEKVEYFARVKSAYDLRSRAVHGGKVKAERLEAGYKEATSILGDLLARCVELGKVPTPTELDHLAASASFG